MVTTKSLLSASLADDDASVRELVRRIAIIAVPSYPMAIVQRCVGLTSAALVGHLGNTTELAAVGLANVVTNITGFSWLWGLSAAISTISSQAWGARSFRVVGVTMQRSFVLLFLFADIPLILIWLSARHLMVAAGQDPETARLVGLYTMIRCPGIIFESCNCVISRTLGSINKMDINLYVSIFSAILNISLSFVLIPRFGFIGAPITATICDIANSVGIGILAWRDPDFRKCWPGLTREALEGWTAFLRLSCPSFVLMCIEWWTWNLQDFLAGFISSLAQATQAVAPQITDLQYATGQSLSNAASTVIGNLLGEGRPGAARRTAKIVMIITAVLMISQAGILFAIRKQLPLLFTNDASVLHGIMHLLPMTLAFSFIDSHQAALSGILIGVGKQTIAAPLVFVCYWLIGVPLGCILAFTDFAGHRCGLQGLWIGMLVAVSLHFVSFSIAVLCIDWAEVAATARERLLNDGDASRQDLNSKLLECS